MKALVRSTPGVTSGDRLAMAVVLSLALHMMITLGIGFDIEDDSPMPSNTLEITLVQTRSKEAPEEADYLAQANQEGGGETLERLRPTNPVTTLLPSQGEGEVPTPIPESQPEHHPKAAQTTLATTQPDKRKIPDRLEPAKESEKPQPTASELIKRSLEIAKLTAELNEIEQTYAQMPRKKTITARTREYKYASYMEAWRLKVQRIGNLNYPDEARRNKLSGALLLDVALKADGTIQTIKLLRTSGYKALDDAAIRIVRLAAPFAPFPPNIRKEVDILHITRTWEFLDSNQLFSH